MNNDDSMRVGFVARQRLPWIVAAASFVLYLLTLNHWVSSESLAAVAKVTDWDWSPQVSNPLLYIFTWPVQWLPIRFQPVVLNVLGALLGALTLGQLARSVALLPHDRTREQRQRERSDYSLLSLKAAWMPPLFACLVCGLQLTFWEEATALTGEILSMFVFACVIRCLLEFRLYQEDRWLYRMALLYGFAIPSDWAFIGYFPLAVGALIWVKGVSSFRPEFIARMAGWGLIGLSTYLLLPLVIWMQDSSAGGFVDLLKLQFRDPKIFLVNMPKTTVLLLSLTSVLPVLVMGIRFPSSIGDVSIVGSMLTNFLFRVMHLVFLAVCVWVAFDPPFSPRGMQSLPIKGMTFYYLGALAVGYFSGYTLLVFRSIPTHSRRRLSRENRFLNVAVSGLLWLGVLGVPIGLWLQNWPSIQLSNGEQLPRFGELFARNLPDEPAIILADDGYSVLLVKSELARRGLKRRYLFIDTSSLQTGFYERQVRESLQTAFPEVFTDDTLPESLNMISLLYVLADVKKASRQYPLYYLRSSFGLYFEIFYPNQKGLVTELVAYKEDEVEPPPVADAVESNQAFWNEVDTELLKSSAGAKTRNRTSRMLANWCSREQNVWAVSLQRAGRHTEAKAGFERALRWNPENISAKINLRQNKIFLDNADAETTKLTSNESQTIQKLTHNRLLAANGPIDTADFCRLLAGEFAQGSSHRQAMLHYKRASILDPANIKTKLSLANSLILSGFPEESLAQVAAIQAENRELSPEHSAGLVRLEAWGHFEVGKKAAAAGDSARQTASFKIVENLLESALTADPKNEGHLDFLSQFYMATDRYEAALTIFDRHLAVAPDNIRLLQNKAVAHIRLEQYQAAVELSDQVLAADAENVIARLNRAIARYRMGDHAQAKVDYEAVEKALPKHRAVYYGLGRIAEAAGDRLAAIDHFEQYLELTRVESEESRKVRKTLDELNKTLDELKRP